jgi:iron-sulfur cluster assembly protein
VLTLTENASTIVKTITDQTTDSDDAGLRFSQEGTDATALAITTADAPQPGDQVVEDGGARVFLEPNAAEVLGDKVLDAQVDESGSVQFTVATQG